MPLTNLQQIVDLAKARGFVYQGSEIYGGLANAWDYGPYGSMMKENIKNLWIKEFVQKREDMMLLDSAILMNPQTWVASGHVGGFSDPLMDCKACNTRHRADKILEEKYHSDLFQIISKEFYLPKVNGIYEQIKVIFPEKNSRVRLPIEDKLGELEKKWGVFAPIEYTKTGGIFEATQQLTSGTQLTDRAINAQNMLFEEIERYLKIEVNDIILEIINLKNIPCPNCGKKDWGKIQNFNLMFKTFQGVTEDSTTEIYLRPETAQGIFVNFANIARTSRKKVPFGVAQVGKAFRNEITPGNFIFRTREFEQMEIEYFCELEKSLDVHTAWKDACWDFLTSKIGLKADSLKKRDHEADELSHYSKATTDIEFKFPFGWGELWGIAHRGDFDLKAHMTESKADLSYFDPVNNKKYIPHVIEPSVGLTRLFLATLCDSYTEEEIIGEEGTTIRTYLKLDPRIAPVKVGVLPVVKKIGDDARAVFKQLSEDFVCEYDEAGSVGKRYARFDEIGTPFCVTIDSENYANGDVTVRHRDSMEQELVKISELNDWIQKRVK